MDAGDPQQLRPKEGEKSGKPERVKPIDKGIASILAVVRRSRQEAEQFTAELLALEESDANSKEMDAMFSNILSRFFVRKAKYMRNFDDFPMQFINEIAKSVVIKIKQHKANEFAKEMMSLFEEAGAAAAAKPAITEIAKAMETTVDASGYVAKKQRLDEEEGKPNDTGANDW